MPSGARNLFLDLGVIARICLRKQVEHRDLPAFTVALALRGLLEQRAALDEAPELLARIARRIEGASLDERLDHTLVASLARHAVGVIVQRRERPVLLALLDDELDDLLADALETRQAKAHALGRGREVAARLVDVRRGSTAMPSCLQALT